MNEKLEKTKQNSCPVNKNLAKNKIEKDKD